MLVDVKGNPNTYSIFIKCLTTGKGGGSEGKEKKGREKEGERGGIRETVLRMKTMRSPNITV